MFIQEEPVRYSRQQVRIARASMAVAAWTVVPMFSPAVVRADDYAQWRGPHRNGLSDEKGLLQEWPKEGPKLVWQVKDAGYGFGSPAISGGRIFLISNQGTDEYVQALSTKDGRQLWKTTIGKVGRPDQNPNYPGARSTPTIEGENVYVLSSDGDLVSLSASRGLVHWKKNVRSEFAGAPGLWAYAESPLVDGDLVVCTPGGSAATLVALEKRYGGLVWKCAVPGGDEACYASVVPMMVGRKKQYVQFLKHGLIGVDAATGKMVWRFDKTAEMRVGGNIPTPVVYESDVYSASGMVGAGLARIKASGSGYEAEQVYLSKKLPNAIGGAVRVGDCLYGTGSTSLYCVDFKTGAVKWEDRGIGAGSVVFADGQLYLHGENGGMALVEATPEGYREKGRFSPPEQPERKSARAWAYPAIANGRLYVRDLGCLWCYDVRRGK